MADPWASVGDPVDNTAAPATPVAAPQSASPQQSEASDPYSSFAEPVDTPQAVPTPTSAAPATAQAGDVVPIQAPPEVAQGLLKIWNDPNGTADQYAGFAAQHGFEVDPAVAEDAFAHRKGERLGQDVAATAVVQKTQPPQPKAPDESISPLRQKVSDAVFDTINGVLPGVGTVLRNHADSGRAYIENNADAVGGDFGPEVGGFMRTVAAPSEWGNFSQNMANNTDTERAIFEHDSQGHPIADIAGQLTGAGLVAPVGGEALDATAIGSKIPALARAAAGGAIYGAGAAGPDNRLAGAISGAATGAALHTILPVAIRAITPSGEAAPSYAELARDLNIRRTPATNSKTGVATVIQSGLGALPGGGPIAAGAQRETGDLANAARSIAENVGPVSTRQGAGEAVANGAAQYKAASKLQANSLYGQRDALMGGPTAPVPTDNAKGAIADIAARFPNSPAIQQLREHPAIRAIAGALPGEPTVEDVPTGILDADGNMITRPVASGGEPLNLGEVTEALSHVRGVVRNLSSQTLNGKATAPVLARVKAVEQGLEDDVNTAAAKADIAAGRTPGAAGSAFKAQRDADAFYADRAQALNSALKKPLQSAADDTQVSGEQVYNQVYHDMNAQSGNLSRLRDTWFRLPDQAKQTFAATAIDDLGRAKSGAQNNAGDAWSFNTFLTNRDQLSPQARNIVFGAKADSQLDQIATYANRLRQLDKARNFSNTAQKYFAGAFMATVGGAVMHGDLGTAAEAAMALPATWGGAKLLLATPAMRDWTAQALRAMALPAANREAALKVLTKRLTPIAAANPASREAIASLQNTIMGAANDNLHAAAASGGNQNPQAKKQ